MAHREFHKCTITNSIIIILTTEEPPTLPSIYVYALLLGPLLMFPREDPFYNISCDNYDDSDTPRKALRNQWLFVIVHYMLGTHIVSQEPETLRL
jgi:hypothetical protein